MKARYYKKYSTSYGILVKVMESKDQDKRKKPMTTTATVMCVVGITLYWSGLRIDRSLSIVSTSKLKMETIGEKRRKPNKTMSYMVYITSF